MISIDNAQRLINDYNYLIGDDYKGGVIEVLLITPRNDPEFTEAISQYIRTSNSLLIYPASNNKGYTVTAILDRSRIDGQGVILHAEIFGILNDKEIDVNYSDYEIEL